MNKSNIDIHCFIEDIILCRLSRINIVYKKKSNDAFNFEIIVNLLNDGSPQGRILNSEYLNLCLQRCLKRRCIFWDNSDFA